MTVVFPIILCLYLVILLLTKYIGGRSKNSDFCLFLLYVSFLHLPEMLGNIVLLLLGCVMLQRIKEKPNSTAVNIYIFFIIYAIFNVMFLSQNYRFGIMMLVKLIIPFIFLLFGYNAFSSEDDYITCIHKFVVKLPLLAILSSYPISLASKVISPIMKSWSAGDAEMFAVILCVPLSFYMLTKQKKYLYQTFFCFFPSLTLMRRTVMGGQFLAVSTYLIIKKGLKAVALVIILAGIAISAILYVPELRERMFGINSNISNNKELLSSTDNIDTNGRSFMWDYVTDKFYVGHETFGCGFGTMKAYLRQNVSGETESFEMLHNDHLHLLIESGRVGVSLLAIFFICLVVHFVRSLRRNPYKTSVSYLSTFCALSASVAIFFCMFFSNILSQVYEISICFLFIGIAFKFEQIGSRENYLFKE